MDHSINKALKAAEAVEAVKALILNYRSENNG
jgi:hypothetical protein